jgi:AraC-like DNA-binding protein
LLIETEIPITRISFVATRPSNASVYQDFFNTDIIYQQPQNAITFASELLDLAVLGGDTSMFATVSSHADRLLLQEENQESVVWKVRSILPEALRMQAFRIEDIATRLNLSARTLQRKLSAAGYRYQTLLDETRQSLAEIYIAENKLSMTEISFLIGYQEQSSFNHAFKAWTGISPGEYRQNLCQQKSGEA